MKKLVLFLSLIILASCNNDDGAGDVITNEFAQIKIILPQGKWKVSNFFDNHADRTIDFESFIFYFKEDGTVEGKTDLYTENGTWQYKSTSEDGEQLILQFNGTAPFDEITYDWNIVSLGISKVELSYTNNSNEVTKLLTFVKI